MRNDRNSVFVIGLIFIPIKLIRIQYFPITLIRIRLNQISARKELHRIAFQYVLLPPRLGEQGANYCHSYYAIDSNWTERVQSGKFTAPDINKELFLDWLQAVEESLHYPRGADCEVLGNDNS